MQPLTIGKIIYLSVIFLGLISGVIADSGNFENEKSLVLLEYVNNPDTHDALGAAAVLSARHEPNTYDAIDALLKGMGYDLNDLQYSYKKNLNTGNIPDEVFVILLNRYGSLKMGQYILDNGNSYLQRYIIDIWAPALSIPVVYEKN